MRERQSTMRGDGALSARERRDVDPRTNLIRTGVVLAAAFLLMLILRFTVKEPVEDLAKDIASDLSYPGMFLVTLVIDTFIVPFTPDAVLFLALSGEMDPLISVLFISAGSVLGGLIGHEIGRGLGNTGPVRRLVAPYRKRGIYLFERYGLYAVILAAFTPIPFSTVSWLSGIFGMERKLFFIGALWRVPRFLLWYLVLGLGYKGLGI